MGFFSWLAKLFIGGFGKIGSFSPTFLLKKIQFWFFITVFFWILYNILYLCQCSKPDGGNGVCILNENNGGANTFTFKIEDFSTGGECGTNGPYDISGQQVGWMDTGFVTNGKQLIVYVDGNYFPWGEKQTPKIFGYHVGTVKLDDGTMSEALNITEDYKECEMNTNIKYSLTDDQETKVIYENQLNSYTSANANNRNEKKGKKMIDNNIQGDCIIGNNCELGLTEETQTACVLKHGAGIYMKIGTDTPFSYHIKNYFVPEYELICTNGDECKYQYKTSNAGASYNLIQVPYAIPPVIYQKGINTHNFIWDIRDNVMKNLQILQDYDKETDYKFYTLVSEPENQSCVGDDYQRIKGTCYHSEQKKLTPSEIKKANCPISSTENINLPNELCEPQSGKRIYVKPSDTCYEDNTGKISLTFTSGVKAVKPNAVSYRNNGIHITWVQDIISALFEPFFGSQQDNYTIGDILETGYPKYDQEEQTITVCRTGDDMDALYYSSNGGDWIVKTEKYAVQGLKIKDVYKIPTTETMDASYLSSNKKKCVFFKIKNAFKASKNITDYSSEEVKATTTTLVRFANLEDGLFVQVRNAIMSTSVYHTLRIIVVVWFVFSFGVGFVNREKMMSLVPVITSDWKRFLILLWCTDPKNYEFIDKYLWNGLIYGSQAIAAGILNVVSGIYGTSIVADEPMAFFDDVISSITSKEVFYKLGAVATSRWSFVLFFFLFPLFANSVINFVLAVLGPIVSLGVTMFNFGSVIMLMPLYALMSMFGGSYKNKFKTAMFMIVNEFIHFAFSLGFFGAFVGFIYHYFYEVLDIKICWLKIQPAYNILGFFNVELSDWYICNQGSSEEADTNERFKIIFNMLSTTFIKLMLAMSIFGKLSIKISEMLSNIFSKGGGIFGIKMANETFSSFKDIFSTFLGSFYKKFDENEQKKSANKMSTKKYRNYDNYDTDDEDSDSSGDKKRKKSDTIKRDGVENLDDKNNQDEIRKNKNKDNDLNIANKEEEMKNENVDEKNLKQKKNRNILDNQVINNGDFNNIENANNNMPVPNLNIDANENIPRNPDIQEVNMNPNGDHAGIRENDLLMKENDARVRENDFLMKENNAGIQDGIAGNQNLNKDVANEQLKQNEMEKKELEKKINALNKQTEEWKKFANELKKDDNQNENVNMMAEEMVKELERRKRDSKLKKMQNDNWAFKKENK